MKAQSIYKLLLLLFAPVSLWAQSTFDGSPPPTPYVQNATAGISEKTMGIGNIHSPNLFDGSQNLSIPFYNFSNDYGSYGVSINYNTKGVLLNEIATPTGLHWNLSAGGSLQKLVKDLPDEMNGKGEGSTGMSVYGKLAAALNTTGPGSGMYVDREYDDYMVSVPGLSFTFNIGKEGYIFTHPKSYAKIELLHDGVPITSIPTHDGFYDLSFRVTDDRGLVYHFKNAATDYIETKRKGSGNLTKIKYTLKWDLTKIEFPDGKAIEYEYAMGAMGTARYNTNGSLEKTSTKDLSNLTAFSRVSEEGVSRITTIKYPNGQSVTFNYKTEDRCDFDSWAVDNITIKGGTKEQVYDLSYYYQSSLGGIRSETDTCIADLPNVDYRMYLSAIHIEGTDAGGTTRELYYQFEYDPQHLPYRQWGGKDFFGYYNGETYNLAPFGTEYTIPLHVSLKNPSDNYGVARTYNPTYAKAGLLKSYTNGFGGKVSFEYEGHSSLTNPLTGLPSSPALLGQNAMDGVRIKRIVRTDPYNPGAEDITEYEYAGGQRFFPGGYNHTPEFVSSGVIQSYYYMGDFVTPFHMVNGSNHGYSTVTELRKNELGQVLSRQVTTLTNFSDATSGGAPRYLRVGGQKHYWQYPYADRQYIKDWEMGLPLEIVQYDRNGFITSRVKNQYEFTLDTTSTAGKLENMKIMLLKTSTNGLPIEPFDSVAYRPYTGKALLKKTIRMQYQSNTSYVIDSAMYDYDGRQNLVKTTTDNSRGRHTSVEYLYNYNVAGTKPSSMTAFPDHLALRLGTERWLLPNGGNADMLEAHFSRYEYSGGKIRLKAVYGLEKRDPLFDVDYTGGAYGSATFNSNRYNALKEVYNDITPANFREVSRAVQHDAKGNVLTSKLLGEDIFNANLWDTAAGTKLAEISNASFSEVAFAGFDQLRPGIYAPGDVMQSGNFSYPANGVISAGICGNAYKLQALHNSFLTSMSLVAGKKYIIQFWYRGTLPLVSGAGITLPSFKEQYTVGAWKNVMAVITPTTSAVITIKRNTSDADIDEVRLYPEESEMTSYTYDPLQGIRAVSDIRGRLSFTEYDNMGRVKLVRDQDGNILSQNTYTMH